MGRSSAGRAERATVVPLRGRDPGPDAPGSGRSLKTAAEALTALRLLGANPNGVSAEMLAVALGKSPSTARYLLNTLCQEGYAAKTGALHVLAESPPWGDAWGEPAPPRRPDSDEGRAVAEVGITATRPWRDAAAPAATADDPRGRHQPVSHPTRGRR